MKTKLLLLHFLLPLFAFAQFTPIGADIEGEAADDRMGAFNGVGLSADGSIVAVGAWLNDGNGSNSGHVRVFQNTGGAWIQIGADIDGEAADDNSGHSVSLSADGSIVAIGAPENDGNGNASGHVRVYQYTGGSWIQKGSDIDGEAAGDRSGYSLSLSADGNIVAIGAPENDGNGTNSGHVRVYQFTGSAWTQIGADIDGEAAEDASGFSLSLSTDGSIVAIGAYLNDGNGGASGHVRIYQYTAGTWTQVGGDIDGEAAVDQSGWYLSLSSDGSIVAIGANLNDGNGNNSGQVRVYQYTGGTWTQVGGDIDGEAAGDESGNRLSLNAGGNIVAIGARWNDGNGTDAGHVRIYQNSGGAWMQAGADIDGEAAGDIFCNPILSSNGNIVAIGAPRNDGNGTDAGHVRVFDLGIVGCYAGFSADTEMLCESDSVTFTDLSISTDSVVISWQWSFEGGTPATSTVQNPVITYNIAGEYDVQLIVTDGIYTDTLLQTDFIHVESIPEAPGTPAGPTVLCETYSYEYTTASVPYADEYTWQVIPADAGTITGDSTIAIFVASSSWTGSFNIQVSAVGFCGTGPWSAPLSCSLHNSPILFQLSGTGNGGFCEGDPGSELTLDGSETGVDYELYHDGTATGIIVAGTGSPVSFGFHTAEGLYTALAYTGFCSETMIGQVYVHQWDLPGQAQSPEGMEETCENDSNVYTTEELAEADWYEWTLDPADAGVMTPADDSVTITWNPGFSGNASLSVHGENDCGAGPESDPLGITISLTPDPSISGPQYVSAGSEEQYQTLENPVNTYNWEVTGGEITVGSGTHQVTVLWGYPGEGSLTVMEETTAGCSAITNPYPVVIDGTISIEEHHQENVLIYPNPADETIHISIHSDVAEEVLINISSIEGKVVHSSKFKVTIGENLFQVATANLPVGIYIVKAWIEKNIVVQKMIKQ